MEKTLADLKVGDKVEHRRGSFSQIQEITEVTPSQLRIHGYFFWKKSGNEVGAPYGGHIKVLTPERDNELNEQKERISLESRIKNTYWYKLPLETLRAINELLPKEAQ